MDKAICMNCGKYHSLEMGKICECGSKNIIPLYECHECGKVLAVECDDSYCGVDVAYCSECVSKKTKQ